jgi:glucokinase
MILAGDIGGTKTNLGLFNLVDGRLEAKRQQSFPSRESPNLESIVAEFVEQTDDRIIAACFGIAGPVIDGRVSTPNLAWVVDSDLLARQLELRSVTLLNDLEATGHGIAELGPAELLILNEGTPSEGNRALIAAGTGLGVASLYWDRKHYDVSASEGGHVDFAPRNEIEIELLRFMLKQHARVSVERVLSGPGFFNIYNFLRSTGRGEETPEFAERLETDDPSRVVAKAALEGESPMAVQAMEIFTSIYGAVAGNVALTTLAIGGVYVGGGIAPKIKEKLEDGTFMRAFVDKGRLTGLMKTIPVRVILNERTALLGAARMAAVSC